MPIAIAHPYSARKFACHVMHRARALSTKMNNDRDYMAIVTALLEFNFFCFNFYFFRVFISPQDKTTYLMSQ